MINGRKAFSSCVLVRMCMLGKNSTADASSKPFSGWPAAVPSGDYCLNTTATGTASTSALAAGAIRVSGKGCISILHMIRTWKTSSLTQLSFAPIHVLLEPLKRGGQDAQALGRSRGRFSTKVHVSVDALGNPLRFELTAGQVHDITQAKSLIADYSCEYVIADKAYDSDDFHQIVVAGGAVPVIPPRSRRKILREYDKHLYKERQLVECLINKIKHYRRSFSRFDKLSKSYLGFLSFVDALIWLR